MGVESERETAPSDERFELRRRVGSGGMGTVWEAWDRERGLTVALKTLLAPDPAAIYRFKREFRALADVTHPNLVTLYELFSRSGRWFFTMELLEGVDIIRHLRGDPVEPPRAGPRGRVAPDTLSEDATLPGNRFSAPPDPGPGEPETGRAAALPDLDRLRASIEQLVEGVMALHERGWLHRDIKPSNVMVTPDGRVVLLDFGVVAEMAVRRSVHGRVELVGTPAFMAPEQAQGSAGPGSDWYAVGMLLYEALTGRRAFSGSTSRVLEDKQRRTPPAPRATCPDVPKDLDDLCVALMQRDPTGRPGGRDILAALGRVGATGTGADQSSRTAPPAGTGRLVGRARPIQQLRDALERTAEGRCEIVLVHGASGSGKTAMVREFLREVERLDRAFVLTGRCYERESVPYKAFDAVADELCARLMELRPDEVVRYLPPHVGVLAQVFPVLRRLRAIADAPSPGEGREDLPETRRRAFGALREMLRRIAGDRPLVVFIDDMQWGDADSARLLETVVRAPEAPALLLVGSYRTDDRERSPFLRSLLRRDAGMASRHREIALGALARDEAEMLATGLLLRAGGDTSAAAAIANESSGNPYFIHELVRFAQASPRQHREGVELDALLRERVQELAEAERRLLEAVAVASRPLAQGVALEAAEIERSERPGIVQHLSTSQLVRTSGVGERDLIECYHDRIREAVVTDLSPAVLERWHLRFAEVLEAEGTADAETLAEHLQGAGRPDRAAGHAVRAAERAAASLSFLRAAALYRWALSLQPDASPDRALPLHIGLAEALTNAGLGAEAARAFLDAAAVAPDEALARDLRARAGAQYLRAGYVQEGMELVRESLRRLGMSLPSSPRTALVSLLYHRTALRVRGLQFDERDPAEVSEQERMVADACWATATGLVQIDAVRGGLFSARGVRAALRTGDRYRAARAIQLEAILLSTTGARARDITERYLAAAEEIAAPLDEPYVRALGLAARGGVAVERGEFDDGYDKCERCLEELRRNFAGNFWELGTAQLFSAIAQLFMGRFETTARLTPGRLQEAQERGDVYTVTCLRAAITPMLHLMDDDPDAAHGEVDEALAIWQLEEFQNQHFMAFLARSFADLYAGSVDPAAQRCARTEPELQASLLAHVQIIRASWHLTRGLCMLAAAAVEPAPAAERRLQTVRADVKRLAREGAAWCDGGAAVLRAGLALRASEKDTALEQLHVARARFEHAGMGLFSAPCEWRVGRLIGGEQGRARARAVEEQLRAQGVAVPARMLAAFGPPL